MGFFDAMEINLFSEMKGVVTLNGNPVAGAKIIRTAVSDSEKEYIDNTTTGLNGSFHFERMKISSIFNLLPGQSRVFQKVIIEYEGKEYLAWDAITGISNKGELNEADVIGTDKEIDINMKCELTDKEKKKYGAYITVINGICSWDGQKILE